MNLNKLKEAEAQFLSQYPGGFDDPGLAHIKKSHNVDQLASFAAEALAADRFNQPQRLCEDVVKLVSRASMVSRFEKPPFKTFVDSLNSTDRERLASAIERRLHGRARQRGFEDLVGILAEHKLARWSIVSSIPFYFAPRKEVFVKPTTAKKIIAYLEVSDLEYHATPTWRFYRDYQQLLAAVKKQVAPSLAPNYAALSGFLMTQI